jgi:hydrogenase maturation protease
VKRGLIGGIGNILLGDDGVGPYVVRLLDALYAVAENVEIADLGTPALDLTQRIAGLHSVILVDSIASHDAPGTVVLYQKSEIVRQTPSPRLDPHSPALCECLMAADMLGCSPQYVLLVGIVGKSYEPGDPLSSAVRESIGEAMEAILCELKRLDFDFEKRLSAKAPDIWWDNAESENAISR